jgi:NADH pyrophosphatase NudC (nudix superfamily)
MYMKFCNRCNNKSYSSYEKDQSRCPNCAEDLIDKKWYVAAPNVIKQIKLTRKKQLKIRLVKSTFDTTI